MDWYYSLLQIFAQIFISPVGPISNETWVIEKEWNRVESGWEFIASSTNIANKCEGHPESSIVGPTIIQGSHYLYSGNRLIFSNATPNYKVGTNMNSIMNVSCRRVDPGTIVKWKVVATTANFASIFSFPHLESDVHWDAIFATTIPVAASGILLVLGIIMSIAFSGKGLKGNKLTYFAFSNFLLALHFAFTVPEKFGIQMSPFDLHRAHDIFLWGGTISLSFLFYELKIVNRIWQTLHSSLVGSSILIILSSINLDQAQVGSTMAYISNFIMMSVIISKVGYRLLDSRRGTSFIFQTLAILTFLSSGANDMLVYMGLLNTYPLFPFGTVSMMLFLSALVNLEVTKIYQEHDVLSTQLQKKVEEKTAHLAKANQELKVANTSLGNMKAEAIESAKLVSIGTLATGIAHEINNSLNAVHGSFHVLKTMIKKHVKEEKDISKSEKIFFLIEDGMKMTVDIIQNLKIYASTDTKGLEPQSLLPAIESALSIIKAKINDITLNISIPESYEIMGRKVGLSQIFVNLVGNAADALHGDSHPDPKIEITAEKNTGGVVVEVRDNGPGIPEDILQRIFEPFYTTKDVGVGTGLGLHIVRNEIIGMGGEISVDSTVGEGTTFHINFNDVEGGVQSAG